MVGRMATHMAPHTAIITRVYGTGMLADMTATRIKIFQPTPTGIPLHAEDIHITPITTLHIVIITLLQRRTQIQIPYMQGALVA
ncbi:MAG: hypothetical protein EB103_01790 [Actinobacteria bacterium]|nr:hypothetical protein [Actinomycetota bacterium]